MLVLSRGFLISVYDVFVLAVPWFVCCCCPRLWALKKHPSVTFAESLEHVPCLD